MPKVVLDRSLQLLFVSKEVDRLWMYGEKVVSRSMLDLILRYGDTDRLQNAVGRS